MCVRNEIVLAFTMRLQANGNVRTAVLLLRRIFFVAGRITSPTSHCSYKLERIEDPQILAPLPFLKNAFTNTLRLDLLLVLFAVALLLLSWLKFTTEQEKFASISYSEGLRTKRLNCEWLYFPHSWLSSHLPTWFHCWLHSTHYNLILHESPL